ncbi:MAG TPA: tetratricopeptide repeat protein [Chloroflexota bacterium]|nr:tetratricopeptide repeat protein [Chloroflexota bacterium]
MSVTSPEMPTIFLSYRRDDSAGHAGWLAQRLRNHLGSANVFMDLASIHPGEDFVQVLQEAVGSCDVLLALIGPRWLNAMDAEGHRRLDDPEDFVRREVATALERGIMVIPVLVQGAKMPAAQDLPDPLVPLARRNALELSDARFEYDLDLLLRTISGKRDGGAAEPVRQQLPAQPTPFLGREEELAAVESLLAKPEVRLLTLTGPGGTGKTRLALEVATRSIAAFPNGVHLVPLAPLSDPKLVLSSIAAVVGVREEEAKGLAASLIDYLRAKRVLLVLDSFEHLLEAAPLLAELFDGCRHLKILAASRTPLRLAWEHEYAVPSLSVPDLSHRSSLDDVARYDSVALFVERARAVDPRFALTSTNVDAVVGICQRLDGLPLAIELAAARIRLLPPPALLSRLRRRLPLLTGGAKDLPRRQQTVRGTIDWSYDLLDEAERQVFARLSVFSGGCTLDDAEAVLHASGDLALDIFDAVASLVEKSLMRHEEAEEPRFRMLETIREYAGERLEEAGDAEATRRTHAVHFLVRAQEADAKLGGPEQALWLERLEREHDNLRAALMYFQQQGGDEFARLVGTLTRFWLYHTHFAEARLWMEATLAQPPAEPALRAKVLNGVGMVATSQGDYPSAVNYLEQSLALRRELGDTKAVAICLNNLAVVAHSRGRYEEATTWYEEALALSRELRDARVTSGPLANLAAIALEQGDYERATDLLEETLAIGRQLGDTWDIAVSLVSLGSAAQAQGRYERAIGFLHESLSLFTELGEKSGIAFCLEGLGAVAAGQGHSERAATLWGAAEALREEIGSPLSVVEEASYRRWVDAARPQFAADRWSTAWESGRTLSLGDAVSYALGE